MAKLKRIILPYGGITKVARDMGYDTDTVSKALAGLVDSLSRGYERALTIRKRAKELYKENYQWTGH